jgi:hypothetical protein
MFPIGSIVEMSALPVATSTELGRLVASSAGRSPNIEPSPLKKEPSPVEVKLPSGPVNATL